MRVRRMSGTGEESHGIDLAPMLDFVLNLLIFFIITAVFVRELGFEVNRPSAAAAQSESQDGNIMILITETGEILLDNREVDVRAVRANVVKLVSQKPKAGILVVADAKSPTGIMVQVVDEIRQGGIENVTFATN
jgi:biopolymer transport protein ExbD